MASGWCWMVMNLRDSCSNHHPITTRGFLRTVNWNLNGAKHSTRRGSMSLPMQVQSRLSHFKSHILGLVAAHVLSVAMVSRLFGISRNTFYKQRSGKKLSILKVPPFEFGE